MKKIFVVLIFLFTFCSAYAEYWHFTIVNKTQSTYYLYCAPTQGSEIKIGDTWCGILANVHQVPPGTLDVYADPHLIEHYEGNLYFNTTAPLTALCLASSQSCGQVYYHASYENKKPHHRYLKIIHSTFSTATVSSPNDDEIDLSN